MPLKGRREKNVLLQKLKVATNMWRFDSMETERVAIVMEMRGIIKLLYVKEMYLHLRSAVDTVSTYSK